MFTTQINIRPAQVPAHWCMSVCKMDTLKLCIAINGLHITHMVDVPEKLAIDCTFILLRKYTKSLINQAHSLANLIGTSTHMPIHVSSQRKMCQHCSAWNHADEQELAEIADLGFWHWFVSRVYAEYCKNTNNQKNICYVYTLQCRAVNKAMSYCFWRVHVDLKSCAKQCTRSYYAAFSYRYNVMLPILGSLSMNMIKKSLCFC